MVLEGTGALVTYYHGQDGSGTIKYKAAKVYVPKGYSRGGQLTGLGDELD